jgi:hypothetical protein
MVAWRRMGISELELKLKSIKMQPQTPEQAIASIRKMKDDLGLTGRTVDKQKLKSIFKRAGSFTEEVETSRNNERA